MKCDGVMEDEPDDERLSVESAADDTQLTTRGTLPRRSPLTSGLTPPVSACPNTHACIHIITSSHASDDPALYWFE